MKKICTILLAMAMTAVLSGCGSSQEQAAQVAPAAVTQEAEPQGDLVIPVSEITETPKFYPVTVEGTAMEVFAVKDSSGGIRTAFNTCQSCYTSGNGRYGVDGTDLVCQNCGFHFTADQVGANKNGGCSPWAIGDENKVVTEDTITISYDFLKESKNIFANWR